MNGLKLLAKRRSNPTRGFEQNDLGIQCTSDAESEAAPCPESCAVRSRPSSPVVVHRVAEVGVAFHILSLLHRRDGCLQRGCLNDGEVVVDDMDLAVTPLLSPLFCTSLMIKRALFCRPLDGIERTIPELLRIRFFVFPSKVPAPCISMTGVNAASILNIAGKQCPCLSVVT